MDRVDELGDASVPFRFDVHALFYSDDAVATEAMLHRIFAAQRVNRVNLRREFFRVTPHQVLEVLRQHRVEFVEFTEKRHEAGRRRPRVPSGSAAAARPRVTARQVRHGQGHDDDRHGDRGKAHVEPRQHRHGRARP